MIGSISTVRSNIILKNIMKKHNHTQYLRILTSGLHLFTSHLKFMKKILTVFFLLGLYAATAENVHHRSSVLLPPTTIADLKEYTGMYTFTTSGSPISAFHITEKQGDLYGEADSYGANKLLKQAEADKFVSTSSYGSTIIFLRHAQTKKVNGLQLIIQGNTLEATKD